MTKKKLPEGVQPSPADEKREREMVASKPIKGYVVQAQHDKVVADWKHYYETALKDRDGQIANLESQLLDYVYVVTIYLIMPTQVDATTKAVVHPGDPIMLTSLHRKQPTVSDIMQSVHDNAFLKGWDRFDVMLEALTFCLSHFGVPVFPPHGGFMHNASTITMKAEWVTNVQHRTSEGVYSSEFNVKRGGIGITLKPIW